MSGRSVNLTTLFLGKIGPTLKGKNLLLGEQILFFLELTPNEMGGKNENKRVTSHESVPIHLTLYQPVTVKTLNIGTPRLTTIVVLNIKQFNFTMQECLK